MTRTTTTRQTANGPTAPMRPHPMGPNVRAAPRTQPDERAVSLPKRVIAAVGNRSRGAAAPPSALGAAHRRRLARTAGVLYLAVAVLGGWAHGYVRAAVYVPGNATTTAQNVVDQASLVRYGFVADLAQATLMLLVVLALYRLLQHVNRDHARAMVVSVVVSVAITCLNLVTQLGAVLVANEPAYASAFGPGGRDALVLLLLDLQHNGYLIAQIFFGLWLFPLGLLVYRSGLFPRLIGSALMIGAAAYVIDVPLQFLAPGIADAVSPIVLVPIVIVAEVSMLAYLLIRGVRESAHGPHIPFDPGRGTTEPTENAAAPEQPPHPTPVRP